ACSSYSNSLEQQLEGKSPEEKQRILVHECGNEIQTRMNASKEVDTQHYRRMRDICEFMTKKPVNVAPSLEK
ncbi:MAG: hypothetical protein K2Q01_00850, partial [Rickettsiales bacterium]|nr:hypothetical protein [Rickettsiales bacterium]